MKRILVICAWTLAMIVAPAANAQAFRLLGTIEAANGTGEFRNFGGLVGQRFALTYDEGITDFGPFSHDPAFEDSDTIRRYNLWAGFPNIPRLSVGNVVSLIQPDLLATYSNTTSQAAMEIGYIDDGGSDQYNERFLAWFGQDIGDENWAGDFFQNRDRRGLIRPADQQFAFFGSVSNFEWQLADQNATGGYFSWEFVAQIQSGPNESGEIDYQTLAEFSLTGLIDGLEVGTGGLSAGNPILPDGTTPQGGFIFEEFVIANEPRFFDPPVSVGYDYSVALGDPPITRAMFPSLLGDLDGFDIFALGGGGPALFNNVMGGQWVDFTSIGYLNGISGFSLRDINPVLQLDPTNPTAFVTGLTFATSGNVTLTQTPVTIEWPIPGGGGGGGGTGVVPEPASWAMLIAGFGLTGAAMRRRRRVAA